MTKNIVIQKLQAQIQTIGRKEHVKILAAKLDLTKPLTGDFLAQFTLDELQIFKKSVLERAVAVIGEINELKSRDDFARGQYAQRMFVAEHTDEEFTGEKVFVYSCEPRHSHLNLFTPGAWFQTYLGELDRLRASKASNVKQFPEREKTRIIESLVTGSAVAA